VAMQVGALVQCASLEEHEADLVATRTRIEELRERNKELQQGRKQLQNKIHGHFDNQFFLKSGLKDLKDRGKFVLVASNKNPGPIAQYAPSLTTGMEPHEVYTTSSTKVKNRAFTMLHNEAMQEAANSGTAPSVKKEPQQLPMEKPLPANFSPHQGETHNSVRRQNDNILLGLRSTIHWSATRRPVNGGALLPSLWPPEGCWRSQRKTAAWLSREGNPDLSRSRMHIARLAGQAASAPLL